MKHLRLFKTEAEYDAAVAEGLDYPNVTFVEDEGSVIYKRGRFDAVDLGLPSGTLWASCNVGANSPEEAGQYFQWAEVVGHYGDTTDGKSYNWKSCPYQIKNTNVNSNIRFSKYLGSVSSTYKSDSATDEDALKTRLDSTDDAAAVNMESGWQMPTKEDFEELLSQCDVAWTTLNGVSGSLLTSNINGETLL